MEMMIQSNKMLKKEISDKQIQLVKMSNVVQCIKDDLREDQGFIRDFLIKQNFFVSIYSSWVNDLNDYT